MMTNLLVEWWEGRYALGWRGWLARKLLQPVLYEAMYDILLYGTHIRKGNKRIDPATFIPPHAL